MQERVVDYYNRKRFVEELRAMPIHSFGDVGTYDKIIIDNTADCNDKTTYRRRHQAFVEMLDKINTSIYNNTLDNREVKFIYPTGHYFTDWLAIVLYKAINDYCGDTKLTTIKYSIGSFCFYTKNTQILIFEKIIDRAIAVWNFRAEDKYPFAREFRTYYSNLISDTLEWIKRSYFPKYKIVNPDDNIYIYKNGYEKMLHVSENGHIIISSQEANTDSSKLSRFSGLQVEELGTLVDTPSTLLDLYNSINKYKEAYTTTNPTDVWNVTGKLIEYGKSGVKIDGKLSLIGMSGVREKNIREMLLKYRASRLDPIVKEMIIHWGENKSLPGTAMTVGDILELNRSSIVATIENTYDCFSVNFEVTKLKGTSNLYFARHYLKVGKIDIRRESGNTDTKTFDFIDVEVVLVALETKEKIMKYVKTFKDRLLKEVLDKLKTSKRYQSYNVPIEYLHLHDIVITCDGLAVFMFELKQLPPETAKED